jgi:hypothetical protein
LGLRLKSQEETNSLEVRFKPWSVRVTVVELTCVKVAEIQGVVADGVPPE